MPQMYTRLQVASVVASMLSVVAALIFVMILINNATQETLTNRQNGLTNQAYVRTVACISSKSPTERTSDYVQQCYDQAEKATGMHIERYGDGAAH